jgi:hypothetical protein
VADNCVIYVYIHSGMDYTNVKTRINVQEAFLLYFALTVRLFLNKLLKNTFSSFIRYLLPWHFFCAKSSA